VVRSRSEQRRLERRAKAVRRSIDAREARRHRRARPHREDEFLFLIAAGLLSLGAAIIGVTLFGR